MELSVCKNSIDNSDVCKYRTDVDSIHAPRSNRVTNDLDDYIVVSLSELRMTLCNDFCPYGKGKMCYTDSCMIRAVVDKDKQYDNRIFDEFI